MHHDKRVSIFFLALIMLLSVQMEPASADKGIELIKAKCTTCHNIIGPAPKTVKEIWQRKGPDLFYAGMKYRQDWLKSWLENPTRLRPAGYRFFKNLQVVDGRADRINESALKEHIRLTREEAAMVSQTLMTFRKNEKLIKKNYLDDEEIDDYMAEIKFKKSFGCMSCHRIAPNDGGFTGPEVYSIGKRLQPDYIVSYLKNPQLWDPKTPMPKFDLGENALQTLTKYMIYLSSEDRE